MVFNLHDYWIGGYRAPDADPVDGPWLWSDESEWRYENWRHDSPNNYGEDQYYVFVLNQSIWDDVAGYMEKAFVCKFPL